MPLESCSAFAESLGLDTVYFAAYEGDSPLLERLLTEGRSTEVKGFNGCSAIGAAAERGHEEVVRQLLLFRANVQAVDKFGSTPLHEAAKGGARWCCWIASGL